MRTINESASRLETALTLLWKRSRFTSYFYQSVDLFKEPDIPTLALLVINSRLVLYYSETFILSLSTEEIIGLLVHEMLHVVMNHDHRTFADGDLHLQNLAQDMVINSYITVNRTSFFSRPGQYSEEIPRLELPAGLPLVPNGFVEATGLADPSWEELYQWLCRLSRDRLEEIREQSEIRNTPPGLPLSNEETARNNLYDLLQNPLNIPDEYRSDEHYVSIGDQRGLVLTNTTGQQLPTGVHMLMPRESIQQLRAKKDGLIRFAAADARCTEERIFQEIRGMISEASKQDTSAWSNRLRSLVDVTSQAEDWKYTHGRFNRRYFAQGIYSAGRIFEEKNSITVAVDVSGSVAMQPKVLESAFGVLEELTRKYTIHLVCIDEQLFVPEKSNGAWIRSGTPDKPYTYKRGDWKHIRSGSMGTTFFSPLFNDYMKNHREILLVITDGQIYDLKSLEPYRPTIWIIPEDNRNRFTAPFGRVIAMTP